MLSAVLVNAGSVRVSFLKKAGGLELTKIVGLFVAFACTLSLSFLAHAEDEIAENATASTLHQLSPEDQRILERGEIVEARYIAGGVVGSITGFGIGHAIQGRYPDDGWIFTVTEGVSITVLYAGLISCLANSTVGNNCNGSGGVALAGFLGFLGFHIWEVVDLWASPPRLNRRYHELQKKRRVDSSPATDWRLFPTVVAEKSPGLGLSMSF